jgi:flagellar hook-associated protein 3 FlgL
MQISTNYIFDRAVSQMSTVQADLAKSQAQIAARKQVINPSDAPDQAAAIARLESVMARQDSYAKALDTINTRLSAEDSTLGSASDLVIRIKEISIQAANDTLSAFDRQVLGVELKGLRDQLLSLANAQDSGGNYLFAGSRVRQPAFATDATGQVLYQGDQTRMNVSVGEQRSVLINRTGSDAFVRVVRTDDAGNSSGVGFFQALDDLIKGVNSSDHVAMQRGIGEVDSMHQGLLLARAGVGTDMKVVEQQTSVAEDTTLSLKTTLSNIEDLDYASAITQMHKQMLALEAAQSSFAKISQLSLFNYIR